MLPKTSNFDFIRFQWIPMDPYGFQWIPMKWIPLDSHGFHWIANKFPPAVFFLSIEWLATKANLSQHTLQALLTSVRCVVPVLTPSFPFPLLIPAQAGKQPTYPYLRTSRWLHGAATPNRTGLRRAGCMGQQVQ